LIYTINYFVKLFLLAKYIELELLLPAPITLIFQHSLKTVILKIGE